MIPAAFPHISALMAALGSLGRPAYLAGAPRDAAGAFPARPYAVVYPDAGMLSAPTLAGTITDLDIRVTVTTVADGPEQASDWADRVRSLLLSAHLTVAGRGNVAVSQADSGPGVQRDDDVKPPLFYQPCVYRLTSTV